MSTKKLVIQDSLKEFETGTIVSAETATPITFEVLIDELKDVRVIYVGENHIDPAHHQIQLDIIRALAQERPDVSVGMEMFDRSYQPILDQWSGGLLQQDEFVKKTHWYGNWRYPYELYADILDFVKAKNLRLVALNLPFHIPPKIRMGGIDSLMEGDSAYLPKEIDTTHPAHRAYLEEVFKQHHGRVGDNFESFYQAQCAWEDVMAESVALHLKGEVIVVLAGNGHIIRKFGIPNRAFKRSGTPFRTIYLAPAGSTVTRDVADYIWVTP
ncbi:MAG: ChaN family lipoprotein [Desulfobacterales bacterium]|nr:ChaN family lipoprotein [Desulfobacterales bacterium]